MMMDATDPDSYTVEALRMTFIVCQSTGKSLPSQHRICRVLRRRLWAILWTARGKRRFLCEQTRNMVDNPVGVRLGLDRAKTAMREFSRHRKGSRLRASTASGETRFGGGGRARIRFRRSRTSIGSCCSGEPVQAGGETHSIVRAAITTRPYTRARPSGATPMGERGEHGQSNNLLSPGGGCLVGEPRVERQSSGSTTRGLLMSLAVPQVA